MSDYRIFVGAFPEGDLVQRIQAVRRQYDPVTARIIAPHVTLAGTYWRNGEASAHNESAAIQQLEQIAPQIAPFELVLGGIHTFPPAEKPVIYLGVECTVQLLAARAALLQALGPDKHRTFTPHLTLAMRLPAAKAHQMLDDLARSDWPTRPFTTPIRHICLMQRGPKDPSWRCIARLPLQPTRSSPPAP
jgi:2'-5' RNA ligase